VAALEVGSCSKGCRGAEHGQACTKDRTGAETRRAALESAVQLGRGDEVNRQDEMANPRKGRNLLQQWAPKRRDFVMYRSGYRPNLGFQLCICTYPCAPKVLAWDLTFFSWDALSSSRLSATGTRQSNCKLAFQSSDSQNLARTLQRALHGDFMNIFSSKSVALAL
jgi:hypothetical protein